MDEFFGIDHHGPLKILREIREQFVDEPGLVPLVRQGFYFEDGAVRIKDPDADFFRFQGTMWAEATQANPVLMRELCWIGKAK